MKHIALILGFLLLPNALLAGDVSAQKKPKPRPAQTKVQLAKFPVATIKVDLSEREVELLKEINHARTNPGEYVRYLEEFRKNFNGKLLKFSDGQLLVTNEGVAPLEEAIVFVRTIKPLAPLETRSGLVLAAKAHLNDMIKSGKPGHRGSDGSNAEDRFSRHGTWYDSVGENIVYFSKKAREDVIQMLIDDGVKTRGHRKNIFKPTFKVIGLAVGPASKSGTLSVITFAGDFKDKSVASRQ